MKPIPLMFLSDAPHLPSGLARITKDLAVHCSSLPEFRVAVMGRGGTGSRQLPFMQYNFSTVDQWGEDHIEYAWRDFSAGEKGIILTIWDLSRLHWFARPTNGLAAKWPNLLRFLTSQTFTRWGYFPIDHFGVDRKLTGVDRDTLLGYDRILAYSLWGRQIIKNTIGTEVDWIPHGYDPKVFQPRAKAPGRSILSVDDNNLVIGCVMTNQTRKDWGLAFSIMAGMRVKHPNLIFWAHVDALEREWSLPALVDDFGLQNHTRITLSGEYSSEQLSYMYSACNLTILPSLGEGFGYPLIESMACGVPVIHGRYAAGVDWIPTEEWLVNPVAHRLESPWNCLRPAYDPRDWVECIEKMLETMDGAAQEMSTRAVEHLQWTNLWPGAWKKWFLSGIGK